MNASSAGRSAIFTVEPAGNSALYAPLARPMVVGSLCFRAGSHHRSDLVHDKFSTRIFRRLRSRGFPIWIKPDHIILSPIVKIPTRWDTLICRPPYPSPDQLWVLS